MYKKPTFAKFDWEKLDTCLQFRPSLRTAAEVMGVCPTTIKEYIKKKHDLTYTEYADIKLSKIKQRLVQKAIDMALSGKNNVMMIFCLKNICKWQESPLEEEEESTLEFV